MKQLVYGALVAAAAVVMVGCGPKDPYKEWLIDRTDTELITARLLEGKAITSDDLLYTSELSDETWATAMNAVAKTSALLYAQVVTEVDKMVPQNEGRAAYKKILAQMTEGATYDKAAGTLTVAEWNAYAAYVEATLPLDQKEIVKSAADPLKDEAKAALEILEDTVKSIKNDEKFKDLEAMDAIMVGKDLFMDSTAIGGQIKSSTEGILIWITMLEMDFTVKEFVKKYPVKK